MYDITIVGAGLSGSVIARECAEQGQKVLIIEKREHIGGNCYDYKDTKTGILMNKYGAHLFHTNDEDIWDYVNKFSEWVRWDHKVLSFVDNKYVPVPVNINTVNLLFEDADIQNTHEMEIWLQNEIKNKFNTKPKNSEEMAISRVGRRLYQKIFKPYTQKQWNMTAKNLDPSVTGRIPIYKNFDNRYFTDKYQGLPTHGYTSFVESMLGHTSIQVWLNQDFFDLPLTIKNYAKKIYYTGPIDKYVHKAFAGDQELEYRSLRFEKVEVMNHKGFVLPSPVVNYPSLDYPYTRIVEYKQLPMQISNHSILVREYPSATGEPYYPIPNAKNRQIYQNLCSRLENRSTKTVFVGRLANYKYFNMDDAVKNSLQVYWNETRRLHVIITKFKENISWIQKLCFMLKNVRIAWFVYLKNRDEDIEKVQADVETLVFVKGCNTDSVTVIDHRANVGREGLAWAEYMLSYGSDFNHDSNIDFYNNIDLSNNSSQVWDLTKEKRPTDLTRMGIIHVFLQGNEEAKLFKVVDYVYKNIFKKDLEIDMEPLHHMDCDFNYQFNPKVFYYEDYVNIVRHRLNCTESFCSSFRGEFAVTNKAIQRFTKLHKNLFETYIIPKLKETNDPSMGHLLERLWMFLLMPVDVWSKKYQQYIDKNHYYTVIRDFLTEVILNINYS